MIINDANDHVGEVVFWDEFVKDERCITKFGTIYSATGRTVVIDTKPYFRNDLTNLRTTEILTCQK